MGGPFAEHPVGLAAAAGAAEENLEYRARQQGRLRPLLRPPPDRVRNGGVIAIRHQCFSVAPGTYSACHSSRVAETAGARMTVGRGSHRNAQPTKGANGRRERRPWPYRPAGRAAARIAHDPQHVSERQLAGCGCFLPHLVICTAGRSLGAASARPFSTVSVHLAIARLIENRGLCVSASGSLVPQYGTARYAARPVSPMAITAPEDAFCTTPRSRPSPDGRPRRHRPRSVRTPSGSRASWAHRRAQTSPRSPAAAPNGHRPS